MKHILTLKKIKTETSVRALMPFFSSLIKMVVGSDPRYLSGSGKLIKARIRKIIFVSGSAQHC